MSVDTRLALRNRGVCKRGVGQDPLPPAQKGEARRSLQNRSMRDHQGTNQGGSREGNCRRIAVPRKAQSGGKCVCVSTGALGRRGAGGTVGGSCSEGGKPRCLFQLETRWLMVTAESCEQSGARACSIKNNDLLTSRGRKWQHVPDHLTQLGREA